MVMSINAIAEHTTISSPMDDQSSSNCILADASSSPQFRQQESADEEIYEDEQSKASVQTIVNKQPLSTANDGAQSRTRQSDLVAQPLGSSFQRAQQDDEERRKRQLVCELGESNPNTTKGEIVTTEPEKMAGSGPDGQWPKSSSGEDSPNNQVTENNSKASTESQQQKKSRHSKSSATCHCSNHHHHHHQQQRSIVGAVTSQNPPTTALGAQPHHNQHRHSAGQHQAHRHHHHHHHHHHHQSAQQQTARATSGRPSSSQRPAGDQIDSNAPATASASTNPGQQAPFATESKSSTSSVSSGATMQNQVQRLRHDQVMNENDETGQGPSFGACQHNEPAGHFHHQHHHHQHHQHQHLGQHPHHHHHHHHHCHDGAHHGRHHHHHHHRNHKKRLVVNTGDSGRPTTANTAGSNQSQTLEAQKDANEAISSTSEQKYASNMSQDENKDSSPTNETQRVPLNEITQSDGRNCCPCHERCMKHHPHYHQHHQHQPPHHHHHHHSNEQQAQKKDASRTLAQTSSASEKSTLTGTHKSHHHRHHHHHHHHHHHNRHQRHHRNKHKSGIDEQHQKTSNLDHKSSREDTLDDQRVEPQDSIKQQAAGVTEQSRSAQEAENSGAPICDSSLVANQIKNEDDLDNKMHLDLDPDDDQCNKQRAGKPVVPEEAPNLDNQASTVVVRMDMSPNGEPNNALVADSTGRDEAQVDDNDTKTDIKSESAQTNDNLNRIDAITSELNAVAVYQGAIDKENRNDEFNQQRATDSDFVAQGASGNDSSYKTDSTIKHQFTRSQEGDSVKGNKAHEGTGELVRQASSSRSDKPQRDLAGGQQQQTPEQSLVESSPIRNTLQSSQPKQIIQSSVPVDRRCRLCWCCCCPCSSLSSKNNVVKNEVAKPPIEASSSSANKCSSLPNVPLEEIRMWGDSFDRLMKCPEGRKVFQDFLRCEYSEENILFWIACEELKSEKDSKSVATRARDIYEDYISILSAKEVSVQGVI